MLRICAEKLPVATLRDPAVVRLLVRSRVAPLLAAPDHGEGSDAALHAALRLYLEAGLDGAGLWPLLSEDVGYWPSERVTAAFIDRVERLLRHGPVPWLLVDLEPPLAEMKRVTGVPQALVQMVRGVSPRRFRAAARAFDGLAHRLRAAGTRTIACAVPLVVGDFACGGFLWQDAWESPLTPVAWDIVAPMNYTTLLSGYGLGPSGARRFAFEASRICVRRYGAQAGAFVGLVGRGVLGNEPCYAKPEELADDAAALRAAGVGELIAFSLEGLLAERTPERWLAAFTAETVAEPHGGRRGLVLARALSAVGCLAAWYRPR